MPRFQTPQYLTRGVQRTLPGWLGLLLWSLIDRIPNEQRNYLQVFRLTHTGTGQHITHPQEQPAYSYETDVPCDDAVNDKIFVIDDQTHSTMLLAEEFQKEEKAVQQTHTCANCGDAYPVDEMLLVGDDLLCPDCAGELTILCNECGRRIYQEDEEGNDAHVFCHDCCERYYIHCDHCGALVPTGHELV